MPAYAAEAGRQVILGETLGVGLGFGGRLGFGVRPQVRVKVRASVRVGVSLAPTPILTPTLSLQRFREQLWTGPTGKKTRRRSQVHTALSLYLN